MDRIQSSPSLLDSTLKTHAAILPQKRKAPPSERDFPPGTFDRAKEQAAPDAAIDPQLARGEYETGRVICESCGEGISFRDEVTGGFTVKHWDAHRLVCSNSSQTPDSLTLDPETQLDASQPQAKRRRAKRTEEERIEYLRSDPYVAQFEAYRVLCASCDKWIRLRPNSTYCSIPWDAHRKSCLAKRIAKNAYPAADRKAVFANDPNVRKFDAERVLCKTCETWIPLGSVDNSQAAKTWLEHRANCQSGQSDTSTTSTTAVNIPTIDSVPPPSKHLLALASSSSLPATSPPSTTSQLAGKPISISAAPVQHSTSPSAFKDFTPNNFLPAHESRRRNAEQRAAQLRSDPLVGEVEPNRVFCSLCQKWVQLRQDSSYCAYPWLQHRGKCLKRHQRRTQRETELAELRAQREAARKMGLSTSEDGMDESDEPESEEGVESGDEEEKERRREQRREERRKAKALAKAEALAARLRLDDGKVNGSYRGARPSVSELSDEDTAGDDDMDVDVDVAHDIRLVDLDAPSGRLAFIFSSVRYLFRTTYEKSDDLTIAALVTYLNAAMPPDKHEDFDTAEVTKAAMALHERGDFMFEGDVLRVAK
ncbi:hypothetical protein AcW1_006564 [Taiwanofungus camphoratus]|nr:hypothetical protein AcW1_006564 [Antrodia cinnamomea]